MYTTFESGNVSVLHVYEKVSGKEVDTGGLRHKSRGRPYDVIAYADSQQPLYNSLYSHRRYRHRCISVYLYTVDVIIFSISYLHQSINQSINHAVKTC